MSQETYEKGGENRLHVMQKLEMPPKNPPKSTQQTPPTFLKTHTSVDILEPWLVSWAEVLYGLPLFPPHHTSEVVYAEAVLDASRRR